MLLRYVGAFVVAAVTALAAQADNQKHYYSAYAVAEKGPAAHARLAKALTQVYGRLASANNISVDLFYSPDAVYNAFASVANDHRIVVVYRPVIQDFENDPDALAYVVGHEIGHHLAGHTTSGVEARKAIGALAQLLGAVVDYKLQQHNSRATGAGALAGSIGGTLAVMKYTRDQEREADAIGLRLAAQAGYDPQGAVRAQEAMVRRSGDKNFVLFDSHPSSGERVQNLRAQIAADPTLVAAVNRHSPTAAPTVLASVQQTSEPTHVGSTQSLRSAAPAASDVDITVSAELRKTFPAVWSTPSAVRDISRNADGKPYAQVAAEMKSLADSGNAYAKGEYAAMLVAGRGVPMDRSEGCRLAREAWHQGAWDGALLWALCLANGQGGGAQDDDRAMAYQIVCDMWDQHGVRLALGLKGFFYEKGYGVPQNDAVAAGIYRKATELGDARSAYHLAKLMDSGALGINAAANYRGLLLESAKHGFTPAMVDYADEVKGYQPMEALSWLALAEIRGEPRAAAKKAALTAHLTRFQQTIPANVEAGAAAEVRAGMSEPFHVPAAAATVAASFSGFPPGFDCNKLTNNEARARCKGEGDGPHTAAPDSGFPSGFDCNKLTNDEARAKCRGHATY